MIRRRSRAALLSCCVALAACDPAAEPFLPQFGTIDILIEDGDILDGLGHAPVRGDVVIVDDRIVFVGDAAFSPGDLAERVRLNGQGCCCGHRAERRHVRRPRHAEGACRDRLRQEAVASGAATFRT